MSFPAQTPDSLGARDRPVERADQAHGYPRSGRPSPTRRIRRAPRCPPARCLCSTAIWTGALWVQCRGMVVFSTTRNPAKSDALTRVGSIMCLSMTATLLPRCGAFSRQESTRRWNSSELRACLTRSEPQNVWRNLLHGDALEPVDRP